MSFFEKSLAGFALISAVVTLFFMNFAASEGPYPSAEAVAECHNTIGPYGGVPRLHESRRAKLETCLIQRDPVYASAVQDSLCKKARTSGAKPEAYSEDFRKRCF